MKHLFVALSIIAVSLMACDQGSSKKQMVKKGDKKGAERQEEEDGPQYIDHTLPGGGQGGSRYPSNNGRVPLTINPGTGPSSSPSTQNPAPKADPNIPKNISQIWADDKHFTDANVDIKTLVTQ